MKKIVVLLLVAALLVSCGGGDQAPEPEAPAEATLQDGTYTGESDPDEWGGKVIVTLTIEGGEITACDMQNVDKDGVEKDEEYGKTDGEITNPGLYQLCQDAVEGSRQYPGKLLEVKDINQVEVISGATITHGLFVQAVNNALDQAKE